MQYDKARPTSISSLFDSIAERYDLGNAILSGNLHRLWNRRLVKAVVKRGPKNVLDLCCGTGEIAKRVYCMLPNADYSLVDFSEKMLEKAKVRLKATNCHFYKADAQNLPFQEQAFCAATIAYGIRNVQDRLRCFEELYRVLKPKGLVAIAELTRPEQPLLRALHSLYLRTLVPLVGRCITSNEEAYKYLCTSIEAFVSPEVLVNELRASGFINVSSQPQTFGIATLFFAEKP
jgi:demethylmenaquinone methyltransferase / 2-methoxy-6-polyprenyl-1,4-benzoquinol methylase